MESGAADTERGPARRTGACAGAVPRPGTAVTDREAAPGSAGHSVRRPSARIIRHSGGMLSAVTSRIAAAPMPA